MVIRLHNLQDGQSVSLHLPILCGDTGHETTDGFIEVSNISILNSSPVTWPITDGVFKVLVRLKLGENKIRLVNKCQELLFTLIRYIPELPYFVRLVYIICADDDDGRFQGPEEEDCSIQSALERITLAAMLLQTFTAEKMQEHGFGRRTYKLEMNEENEPVCHIFKSQLTLKKAHSLTGNELWTYFANELMRANFIQKSFCKWLCFMSFTQYRLAGGVDPPKSHSGVLKHTKGHAALGGGGLALLGSGTLHTWAKNIEELPSRLTDVRKVDKSKFMDDSAYREYYWANFATGLGSTLHELGHTFDLAHTPSGIMARGFDDINQFFSVSNNKTGQQSKRTKSNRNDIFGSFVTKSGKVVAHVQFADSRSNHIPLLNVSDIESSCSNTTHPLIVILELNFQPLVPHSVIYSVQNYDGTTDQHTITGQMRAEVVTDVPNKENHLKSAEDLLLAQHTPFADGGAYWYRSSAVLLRFHRWFNCNDLSEHLKGPEIIGNTVTSSNGLGLVELRCGPRDKVFRFVEFTCYNFPKVFDLRTSQVTNLPQDATCISIFVQDRYGLIATKKMSVEDFHLNILIKNKIN